MEKEELFKLLNLYKARYGAYTMDNDTMKMWARKLLKYEYGRARDAFDQLLGTKEERFGWRSVVMVIDSMHPPETDQDRLDKEWRKNPIKQSDTEKQTELNIVLRGLLDECARLKKRGEAFDWMGKYADSFVEVWGQDEALSIMGKITNSGANGAESGFYNVVYENIKKRRA